MVFQSFITRTKIGDFVKKQAKKNNEVIFGARSLKRRMGLIGLARQTTDWDVKTKNPKKSAKMLERTLDKNARRDDYYSKPALHPGTWKVMDKGFDRRKGTDDDIGIADYGKMEKGFKHSKVDGIKYSTLRQEAFQRRKSLKDPASSFRHEKDARDLKLINFVKKMKRY